MSIGVICGHGFYSRPLPKDIGPLSPDCGKIGGRDTIQEANLSEETVKRIEIDNLSILKTLFGNLDANVRKTEDAFGVRINSREGAITIAGPAEQAEAVEKLFSDLILLLRSGEKLDEQRMDYAIQLGQEGKSGKLLELMDQVICVTSKGRLPVSRYITNPS